MIRRPPRSTRTDTLFPYTTLFRSSSWAHEGKETQGGRATASAAKRCPVSCVVRVWQPVHWPAGSRTVRACASAARYFRVRSEEHTSELQSLMRISYAVFCLKKKT